ncbi:hypothetical protein SCP_1005160 [Sparassis crispa]|uniref:Aminoglycoside phosphotransferase domain-containing protein n=1 Tax=Sparassis crispa TaxID=139825 RepID=A0A401GYN5_9APHY|nr:hypothetical protein SCP_1005160 [Sparassis crispa]GBE87269.1 hypothetical protein SCP_1005160 [Sparassis crispa]
MEFIPGRTLKDAWPDMTAASKDTLTEQLRVHMNSLRSLRGTYIGGLGCTPCFDHIFADEPPSDCGPFPNVAAFHDTLAKAINRYGVPEGFPTSRSKCRLFKDDYHIVFSHGDFASRNIMLSEEGKLAAILDWETAGFWPEYWEWMKASIDIESEPYDWGDALDLILEPFDADALIENMFLRVLLL